MIAIGDGNAKSELVEAVKPGLIYVLQISLHAPKGHSFEPQFSPRLTSFIFHFITKILGNSATISYGRTTTI